MIKISPVNDKYVLDEAYYFEYDGHCVVVPCGYVYDGASIPPLFWQLMGSPFHPQFMTAALAHDYLYETHEQPKEYADLLFKHLLIQSGVPAVKAMMMYESVNAFGGFWWDA